MASHQEIREAVQRIQQRFADLKDKSEANDGGQLVFTIQDDLGIMVATMMNDINILAVAVEELVDDIDNL